MNQTRSVPGTAAFHKFMRVLQTVSDHPGELSVGTLAKKLQLPRPTVYRIVEALQMEGMLDDSKETLKLGPRLVSLAWRSLESNDLRKIARPHIEQLRDILDETVHLAIPSGLEMVYIDKVEANRAVRMTSRIGTRVSLYSSSVGKAWLAAHSPEQVDHLLDQLTFSSFTEHTITSVQLIRDELDLTRKRGFSIDNQENELDICCYGCAILNQEENDIAGCISVSMPAWRFQEMPEATALTAIGNCIKAIQQHMKR